MKIKKIPIHQQLAMLKTLYKESSGTLYASGFIWKCYVKPTSRSESYLIKISYREGKPPRTYVLSPSRLSLAPGAKRLPHTYKSSQQRLCLYYPLYREWDSSMPIATTIVHWAVQWLFFYELWKYTGTWYGGGIGNWNVSVRDNYKKVS